MTVPATAPAFNVAVTLTRDVKPINWVNELVELISIEVTPVVTWLELVWLDNESVPELDATLQLAISITNIIDKIDLNIFILKHLKVIIYQRKK
jgi:hypothetical protein